MKCEQCGIFKPFVTEAGPEEAALCYPCYFFGLGKYAYTIKWLNFRRVAGEEEEVEQWIKWNNERESTDAKEKT